MATKARFGRLPRSAPSLTSTIVSLAQQYQQTRDRNIEDAWKNGGQFEGKKVTDEQFLAHWKDRRASVSQDDPMWDYYNNQVYQYEFTIDESKMGQKYAERKVSDGQMAAFYREWARKMPPDSQNYRQLMTQAAKFRAASSARGYGDSSRAAAAAYAGKQQDTYNKQEAPYDVATMLLTRYAVNAGYLDSKDLNDPDYGWSKLTNAAGENDPANFANLLSDIMSDPATRAGMTQIIRQYDPHFSGQFTDESLAQLANNARNGANTRVNRATAAGDKGGVTAAQKSVDKYAVSSMVIRASLGDNATAGFVEQNEFYRGSLDAVLAPDSGASPLERAAAIQRYGSWLQGDGSNTLAKSFPAGSFDPLSPNYNVYASGLLGRVQSTISALSGKPTGLTLKDDLFGFSTGEAGKESDAFKLGTSTADLQTNLANVQAGASVVVRTDESGKPDPNGGTWSILDRNSPKLQNVELVPLASPAYGLVQFGDGKTLGGEGGEVRYQMAQDIRVQVYGNVDPNSGAGLNALKAAPNESDVVGSRVQVQGPGGTPYTIYGIWQNGQKVWTTVDPFAIAGRGSEGVDNKGNYVISYQAPNQVAPGRTPLPFSPSQYVSQTMLKQPTKGADGKMLDSDGTPWDPATDKQTAWGSPLSALANSSSEALKYVETMGGPAIQNAERQWYSDTKNWTPTMKQQAAQGIPPENVVAAASGVLYQQVVQAHQWGYTPEAQQANRQGYADSLLRRELSLSGMTMEQYDAQNAATAETARRADIAASLDKWSKATTPVPMTMGTLMGGGVPIGDPSRAEKWVGKGWNLNDLLNQPGMSLDQANDLAFQISGGAVGTRLAGTQATRVLPGRGPQTYTTQPPPSNPYLPGGVVPVKPLQPGKAADDIIAPPVAAVRPTGMPPLTAGGKKIARGATPVSTPPPAPITKPSGYERGL